MEKKDIIDFFDRLAPNWDAQQVQKDRIISRILDYCGSVENKDVLDVACGTGILFPFYLERNAASVTGVDISGEMCRIAEKKFSCEDKIKIICADINDTEFSGAFDLAMVYNAFPHFVDPEQLMSTVHRSLKEGGRISVAHGLSREAVDKHHNGAACKVSNGLMSADELAELMKPWFDVYLTVSNEEMYQVCGIKKNISE